MSGEWNTGLDQGATFTRTLTWKDADGNPVDLTGYTAEMSLRKNGRTANTIDLSTTNARIVLGGTAGTILLTIAAGDTASIEPGVYRYDLKLTSPDSPAVVTRLVAGQITVTAEVTE